MPRPKRDFATRFVGANIPLGLYEVFNKARAELGYESITDAVEAAISVWIEQNPPSGGIPRSLSELIQASDRSRALRNVLDQAILEFRAGGSADLLTKIAGLRDSVGHLQLPPDIEEAMQQKGL